ncbi:MAG: SPASM domain-containing protein [Sedimentisphaerales bacterium]|nr:SPASM domain-containing protein [Sedimentisphaerales bacterium]
MAHRKMKKLLEFATSGNHTPRRLVNKTLSVASKHAGLKRALGYPSHLMIEVSSACQLNCPLCPLGNGTLARPRRLMRMETFEKIIDNVGDFLYHVNINGMGEPLLNGQVCRMIEYAKARNVYVDLYTNLQIDNDDMIEGLVDSGLDAVLISCDGATRDVYEKYRVNGDFDRLLDNIRTLVQYKKRKNAARPEVNVQCILFEHNEAQLPEMTELIKSLEADHFVVKRPFLFWGTDDDARFLPRDKKVNPYEKRDQKIDWSGKTKSTCTLLWSSSTILADGSVVPCCFDYEGKVRFGNVNEESFRAIWNNRRYRRFRRQVRRNWRKVTICNSDFEGGCPTLHVHPDDWIIKTRSEAAVEPPGPRRKEPLSVPSTR